MQNQQDGAGPSSKHRPRHYSHKSLTALQRLFAGEDRGDDVPMAPIKHARNETDALHEAEETARHLWVSYARAKAN